MKVTISIVNWNTEKLLKKCLASVLRKTKGIASEAWVFDNGSKDKSIEMVRKKFPRAKIIKSDENIGFGKAHNQVFEKTKGEYFAIVNSDIEFKNDVIAILSSFLDEEGDAAAVSCLLLNRDGSIQENISVFPTLLREIIVRAPLSKNPYLPKKDYSKMQEVESFSGACFMVRRKALEGKLFDESFFAYSEETDLFFGLKKRGWKIFFEPKAIAVHYGGASSSRSKATVLHLNGTRKFFRKNFGLLQESAFRMIAVSSALLKFAFSAMTFDHKNAKLCVDIIKSCLV